MRLARSSWLYLLLVLTAACNGPGESPLPPPDAGPSVGRISGQVALDDAAPPEGIAVTVQGTELKATTDTEGRFTLVDVSPGAHTLIVQKPLYREASEAVEVKARQTASATLTLQRERGGLTGTVQLEGGASAEGITVALTGTSHQTQTDAQGHFVFTALPTGSYTVQVLKETYAPAQETVEVAVDAQASVALSLQRERGNVAGTILLEGEARAENVLVTLVDTDVLSRANAQGQFILVGVPTGTYTLRAQREGYVTHEQQVEVRAGAQTSVTRTLSRERGSVAGTFQLEGVATAGNIAVLLVDTNFSTQTNAQGKFSLTGIPTGTYTLRASRDTYVSYEQQVEIRAGAQTSVTQTLSRERGSVAGTFLLEGGASAGDIAVQLVGTEHSTVTDAEGRFTFTGVLTGMYTLRVRRDGYDPYQQTVEVRANAQTSISQTLTRERGTVVGLFQLEGGGSAADIAVQLVGTSHATGTDAEGRFTLTGVITGTYTLRASRDGYAPYEQQVEVRPNAQSSVSQTLTRERGTVAGTVLLEGGVAVANIEVALVDTDFTTQTNDQGAFALTGIPTGTYTLRARRDTYVPYEQQVEVRANAQTSVSGLLYRERGDLSGRVVLEDGESAAGLTVVADGPERMGTTTDAEGRFSMPGLLAGAYTVSASKDHYASPEVSVEVRVDEPATVELTLTRQGAPTVVVPKLAVQRGHLELTGSGFGAQRGESHVSVGGVEVTDYFFWSDTRVMVRVPANVSPGVRDVVVKPGPAWRPAATVSLRVVRQQTLAASIEDWNLGITPDDTVTGWGPDLHSPPGGLSDVVSVAVGSAFAVALKADGTVVEWGDLSGSRAPVPTGLSDVVAISAASNIAAALRRDGTVVAWGGFEYDRTKVPAGLQDVVAISVSMYFSLALKADGTVATWGRNEYGQTSLPPADLSGVKAIGGNTFGSAAILSDGTLRGWDFGASHNGYENVTDPVGFIDVRGGYDVLVALRQDGTLRAWGRNDYGQASPPATLTDVVDAMPMGIFDGVALLQDGTLKTWGVGVQFRLPPAGLILRVAPR
ncbi:putative lipoprotein [Corallococcus coralloides DSM 2259]|uniref:Putative lipoprotein n=1 Tax=Corallococcus coralloides (strain ATCC 25202 / DSM 2259 / NBRC 100086 / M2) TaxID=1144275 RepID=H8MS29_CORCM|nr:carboxypeptidase regulatory-like domain-containing protein [Corallococcus coralloides]AFE03982.1 putative lipoprotein [Corallococcus coralloides DSM 2259]